MLRNGSGWQIFLWGSRFSLAVCELGYCVPVDIKLMMYESWPHVCMSPGPILAPSWPHQALAKSCKEKVTSTFLVLSSKHTFSCPHLLLVFVLSSVLTLYVSAWMAPMAIRVWMAIRAIRVHIKRVRRNRLIFLSAVIFVPLFDPSPIFPSDRVIWLLQTEETLRNLWGYCYAKKKKKEGMFMKHIPYSMTPVHVFSGTFASQSLENRKKNSTKPFTRHVNSEASLAVTP